MHLAFIWEFQSENWVQKEEWRWEGVSRRRWKEHKQGELLALAPLGGKGLNINPERGNVASECFYFQHSSIISVHKPRGRWVWTPTENGKCSARGMASLGQEKSGIWVRTEMQEEEEEGWKCQETWLYGGKKCLMITVAASPENMEGCWNNPRRKDIFGWMFRTWWAGSDICKRGWGRRAL